MTVSRWERGERSIPGPVEVAVTLMLEGQPQTKGVIDNGKQLASPGMARTCPNSFDGGYGEPSRLAEELGVGGPGARRAEGGNE